MERNSDVDWLELAEEFCRIVVDDQGLRNRRDERLPCPAVALPVSGTKEIPTSMGCGPIERDGY